MDEVSNLIEAGKNYFLRKDYALAEKVLKEAAQIDRDNDYVYCELGKVCCTQQRYDEAIENLEKSVSLNQDNVCAHFLLAKSYREKGLLDDSIREFKKSLDLNSREARPHLDEIDEQAHFELGIAYFMLKEYLVSIKHLETSISINPDFTYTYPLLAKAYDEQVRFIQSCNFEGKYRRAEEEAQETSRLVPPEKTRLRNTLLNETEIARKGVRLDSKPRSLTVTLTNRCNLECLMCKARSKPWDLPEKKAQEICSLFPYLERVMWQGGEVFLYKGFKELLREANRFGLRQILATNGLLIEPDIAEIMVKSNVELTLSIDGATKDVYEHIRRGANFERIIEKINLINDLRQRFNPRMELRLNVLVMRSNHHQLEQFVDFAHQYKFSTLFFNSTDSDFKDTHENVFCYSQDAQILDYLNKMRGRITQRAAEYGIRLENWLPSGDYFSRAQAEPGRQAGSAEGPAAGNEEPAGQDEKLSCHAPWQRLYIDCGGSVRPDCLCRYENPVGNIVDNTLEELWNCRRLREYRERQIRRDYRDFCSPACVYGRVPEKNLKFI